MLRIPGCILGYVSDVSYGERHGLDLRELYIYQSGNTLDRDIHVGHFSTIEAADQTDAFTMDEFPANVAKGTPCFLDWDKTV